MVKDDKSKILGQQLTESKKQTGVVVGLYETNTDDNSVSIQGKYEVWAKKKPQTQDNTMIQQEPLCRLWPMIRRLTAGMSDYELQRIREILNRAKAGINIIMCFFSLMDTLYDQCLSI